MSGRRTGKRPQRDPTAKASPQLLEVEDADARERRIGNLLAAQDAEQPTKRRRVAPADLLVQADRDRSFTPERAEGLLSRVKDFLPVLRSSNEQLLDQAAIDPNSVDIEYIQPEDDGSDPQHIEMNLGLGVFAMKATPDSSDTEDGDSDDDDDGGDEGPGTDSGLSDNHEKSGRESKNDEGNGAGPPQSLPPDSKSTKNSTA